MEEIQPAQPQNQAVQTPQPTPIITPQPVTTNKTTWIVILLLVLFAGAASYIVYQNYQLKQQLTDQQTVPSSSVDANNPTTTLVPTPTNNMTENWKTFTNTKYGFSFKYPQNMVVEDQTGAGGDKVMVPWKSSIVGASSTFLVYIELRSCNNWDNINKIVVGDKEAVRFYPDMPAELKIASSDRVEIQTENKVCLVIDKYVEERGDNRLNSEVEIRKVMDRLSQVDKDLFETFLSTFKFTN